MRRRGWERIIKNSCDRRGTWRSCSRCHRDEHVGDRGEFPYHLVGGGVGGAGVGRVDDFTCRESPDSVVASALGREVVFYPDPDGQPGGALLASTDSRETPMRESISGAWRGRRFALPDVGEIVLAESLFFTGNTVIVDHGLGLYSLLAHLSRIDVQPRACGRIRCNRGPRGRDWTRHRAPYTGPFGSTRHASIRYH